MLRLLAAILFCIAFGAGGTATAQLPGPIRFDNWLSFQQNTGDSGQWEYDPRLYIPFSLSRGWTFTQRIDLPVSYTDQVGTDNANGAWKAGIGDWFIEEIFATPELAKNFWIWASVRFVFPIARGSPFGSSQYQWAPALSAIYAMPERGITFSPVARYFLSYHATEPGASKIRQLDLYPIVTFALPERWSLVFYPENGISYNDVTKKWFAPIDLMLIRRPTKDIEFGLGGAYALVKDEPQYDYTIYGRITFYF
jgi:hypothetical protein